MAAASPADSQEAFARMILEAHGEAIRRYLRRRGVLAADLEGTPPRLRSGRR